MSKSKKIASLILLAIIIVLNLTVGAVGGVLGVVAVSENSSLREMLGFKSDAVIPTTRTDKVVLEESSAVIDASKKVGPSVVSIVSSTQITNFFGQVIGEETGGGTGFIITNDGLILTNKHVVQDGGKYKVVLQDGTQYDAEVKSLDPFLDLAVVKIEAKNLVYTYITQADLKERGVSDSESDGFANLLNNLDNDGIMLFLKETANGQVKGSLRTTNDKIDVSAVAKKMSGGGHKKAAGFTTAGTIEEALQRVIGLLA